MMYSRRARIGVITPMGESVEYAFNKYAPDGVAFSCTPPKAREHAGNTGSLVLSEAPPQL